VGLAAGGALVLAMSGCGGGPGTDNPSSSGSGGNGGIGSGGSGGNGGSGNGGSGGGQGGTSGTGCVPGTTEPCYNGPAGTEGVGECKPGVRTCDSNGHFSGDCAGDVTPVAKNCATPTIDEQCNGTLGPCTNPPFFAALYGDKHDQIGTAIAVDPGGNMILTGTYDTAIDFGAGPLLAPANMFVTKLDPNGVAIWQKQIVGGISRSLATDAKGNVFVYGRFKSMMDWGGGPIAAGPKGSVFLAKLDFDGNLVYLKTFAVDVGETYDWVVDADPAGEVVITGSFENPIDLGGGVLTSAGNRDVFVARLDASGGHLWSKRFGGAGTEFSGATAIGPQGEIVVVGAFAGTVDFGGGPLAATGNDIFVVKLDASGAHVWSKGLGGAGNQAALGVAIDPSGGVGFIGASSTTSLDLGGGPRQAKGANLTCFLGKLAANGAHAWSQAYGCHINDFVPFGPRVAADPSGAFVVTGSFHGTTDLGLGPVHALDTDVFVLKVDPGGAPVWARTFGSDGYDLGLDVTTDASGNVLLTGHAEGDIDFGGGLLTGHGGLDAYVVKMAP
jgi:hypothetical protein